MAKYAAYIRASTGEQKEHHQRDSVESWLKEHDTDVGPIKWYVDLNESGARDERPQFQQLFSTI